MILTLVSQNVQYGASPERRWPPIAAAIRAVRPHLVMLQELDWLHHPTPALVKAAEEDLGGMRLIVAKSRHQPTAIAYDPAMLRLLDSDTESYLDSWHGHCLCVFDIPGVELPVPLVAISGHLVPHSAAQAAQEAQYLGTLAYRHGGLGLIAGDINHCPVGDVEPDWTTIQPYNRMARCRRRSSPDEPWQADTIVGLTLRDGDLTDVAAHLADRRGDRALRQPTGVHGGVRVDQIHVTAALKPAIDGYELLDTTADTDHHGVVGRFDLSRIDRSALRTYT